MRLVHIYMTNPAADMEFTAEDWEVIALRKAFENPQAHRITVNGRNGVVVVNTANVVSISVPYA